MSPPKSRAPHLDVNSSPNDQFVQLALVAPDNFYWNDIPQLPSAQVLTQVLAQDSSAARAREPKTITACLLTGLQAGLQAGLPSLTWSKNLPSSGNLLKRSPSGFAAGACATLLLLVPSQPRKLRPGLACLSDPEVFCLVHTSHTRLRLCIAFSCI